MRLDVNAGVLRGFSRPSAPLPGSCHVSFCSCCRWGGQFPSVCICAPAPLLDVVHLIPGSSEPRRYAARSADAQMQNLKSDVNFQNCASCRKTSSTVRLKVARSGLDQRRCSVIFSSRTVHPAQIGSIRPALQNRHTALWFFPPSFALCPNQLPQLNSRSRAGISPGPNAWDSSSPARFQRSPRANRARTHTTTKDNNTISIQDSGG